MCFFKKEIKIFSPVDGEVIPTSEIKDETFSRNVMGRGFAVIPTNGIFVSPIKGEVRLVAETGHAFSVRNKKGLEVLVHIGLDTVTINSKKEQNEQIQGFKVLVKVGDKVKPGQPIIEADLSLINKLKLNTTTPVIAINNEFMTKEKEASIIKERVGVTANELVMVVKWK
jgi:glucose-specific phosphotransferase system IIA component